MEMRVGFGFDSHKLVKARRLILGGIEIESEYGLAGFSDADVIIHALCDAFLGAIGEKDIGEHFPDTDESNKDKDSKNFLNYVLNLLNIKNYSISNIDITLILEKPLLRDYKKKIKQNLAQMLKLDLDKLSFKAKRPEGAYSGDTVVCFVLVNLTLK